MYNPKTYAQDYIDSVAGGVFKTSHLKNYPDSGNITVVSMLVDNFLFYGLSICSPKDQFCKKDGVRRAKNRLHKVILLSIPNFAGAIKRIDGKLFPLNSRILMNLILMDTYQNDFDVLPEFAKTIILKNIKAFE